MELADLRLISYGGPTVDRWIIRPATPSDACRIAEIHVRSWQTAYDGILPDEYLAGLSIPKHLIFWEGELTGGRNTTLVADDGEKVIGWISGGGSRDVDAEGAFEIHALYVRPEAQGQGAGRRLMEGMMNHFPPTSSSVTLWVLEENQRGIGFYRHLSFEADGASKVIRIAGEACTEIRLRKEWTPAAVSVSMGEP